MKKTATPIECRDTALALTFLLLLLWWFGGRVQFVYAAMALLLFSMIWPAGMARPAQLWFGLSHLLGTVMNKVILGLVYILILMPVAMIRRHMGKDPMKLRQWKKGTESVFVVRDHVFSSKDLESTF